MDEGDRLRDHFLGWQCRVRQHAVRHRGGRPSPGMRPAVLPVGALDAPWEAAAEAPRLTVLMVPQAPAETTAEFRHIVMRTHDPAARLEAGLRVLAAGYFQRPRTFSDVMTALFAADAETARALLAAGACALDFDQYGQRYRLACTVEALAPEAPAFAATYWHNRMFNPAMPGQVTVLAFTPDWTRARAEPPPPG